MHCWLVVLLLWAGSAAAQSWNTQSAPTAAQTGARAVTISPGASLPAGPLRQLLAADRVVRNGTLPGAVLLDDLLRAPSPAGGAATIPVGVTRAIPWSAVSRGVARALPLVGTALAIKDLLDAVRCQEGFGGAPECDAGTPQIPRQQFCTPAVGGAPPPGRFCATTPQGAASAHVAFLNQAPVGVSRYELSGPTGSGTSYQYFLRICYTPTCTSPSFTGPIALTTSTQNICPASPDGSIPEGQPPGPDGKCETGTFSPASEDQVAEKVEQHGDKSKARAAVEAMVPAGIQMPHDPPTFVPPATVQGGRETTTRPDGSTQTRDTDHVLSPTPTGYEWQDRQTVREWAPGVTPEAPGAPPGSSTPPGTVTTGTGTSGTPVEVITCGLPGKPPCKIDESGTPVFQESTAGGNMLAALGALTTCITQPLGCLPALPDLNWSFTVPTGCTPLALPGFAALTPSLASIDMCQFQPVIHDLLSMMWVAAGFFGAIALILRDSVGGH